MITPAPSQPAGATVQTGSADPQPQTGRRPVRKLVGGWAYSCALLPLGVLSIASCLLGASRWGWGIWPRWQRATVGRDRRQASTSPAVPATVRVLAHGAASVLLGFVGLIGLLMVVLGVLRGPFYGLVDSGPYTDAWGGPSLAGAWAVHALVGVVLLIAALVLGAGLASLHRRIGGWALGLPTSRWDFVLGPVLSLLGLVFFVLWVRQL